MQKPGGETPIRQIKRVSRHVLSASLPSDDGTKAELPPSPSRPFFLSAEESVSIWRYAGSHCRREPIRSASFFDRVPSSWFCVTWDTILLCLTTRPLPGRINRWCGAPACQAIAAASLFLEARAPRQHNTRLAREEAMASRQVLLLATVAVAAIACLPAPAAAMEWMVGDGGEWRLKFNETNWTDGKTFRVGDTLRTCRSRTHYIFIFCMPRFRNLSSLRAV
jgi:hypothetical protein